MNSFVIFAKKREIEKKKKKEGGKKKGKKKNFFKEIENFKLFVVCCLELIVLFF